MECDQCGQMSDTLTLGDGGHAVREARRCRRCDGIVSVPAAHMDLSTGEWRRAFRRARCSNAIGADHRLCGSQALVSIPGFEVPHPDDLLTEEPASYESLTAPCRVCGAGVMRFVPVGLWD